MVPAVVREPFRASNRPLDITDESFDSLLTRRFGESFARTIGSAMVHGIYATDSRNLSTRATFPILWDAEDRGGGSIVRGFFNRNGKDDTNHDYVLGDVQTRMDGIAVYSFRDGIRTITDALVRELKRNPKVQLQSGVGVTSLNLNPLRNTFEVYVFFLPPQVEVSLMHSLQITTTSNDSTDASHVVSTLSPPVLNKLLPTSKSLPHLEANPSSSVTVVNLVFPSSPLGVPLHPPGFGYLVPRPSSGYDESNSGVLGTVFDSSALSEQDTGGLTKMTVMLGGPHPLTPSHTSLPVIIKHLTTHLGHSLPEPLFARTHSHTACIPTLSVGHLGRMDELRTVLNGVPWEGRLEIVGAGVGGVSVGDCVEAGKRVGQGWN